VQVIRIEGTVLCHRAFDPFVLCDQPWRCVQRSIKPSQTAKWQAVEGNVNRPITLGSCGCVRRVVQNRFS
jgi:hypothetical protein